MRASSKCVLDYTRHGSDATRHRKTLSPNAGGKGGRRYQSPLTFKPPLQVLQQERQRDPEHRTCNQPYTDVACDVRAYWIFG
jgi:hypothetical protein